jgi:hypothetical protein
MTDPQESPPVCPDSDDGQHHGMYSHLERRRTCKHCGCPLDEDNNEEEWAP